MGTCDFPLDKFGSDSVITLRERAQLQSLTEKQVNNYEIVVKLFLFMLNFLFYFSSLLQWLSIGTGYGDMEEKIIKSIPDINIDLLECYEPGNEQFNHLKNVDFGLQNKPIIHHEVFDESTILGKPLLTFFTRYINWITNRICLYSH